MSRQLKVLYEELAAFTQPKCGQCAQPFSCCRPIHCRTTRQWARAFWGVHLPETGHPELPLMGAKGCTAPPHLRPHCSAMVCDSHLDDEVFRLRWREMLQAVEDVEVGLDNFETET